MGGAVFAAPLVYIIFSVMRSARKKKMSCEFWAILYAAIASNFIPDILNARFFIIPCAVVFLIGADKKASPPQTVKKEKTADPL